MALKAQVEDIESIPEGIRDHYTRDGESGPYTLSVEGSDGWALENVGALKRSLSQAKEERREAKERLDRIGDVPADVQERLSRLAELEKLDPEKLADEKVKAHERALVAKHQELMGHKDEEITFLASQVSKHLVYDEAMRALLEEKGSPELLLPLIEARTRVRRENGRFIAEVLDEAGNPRIGDAQGNPLSIAQLVSEMKADPRFGRAFDGTDAAGSGASGSSTKNGGGAAGQPKHRGDFANAGAKAAWVGEHGLEAFKKLPAPPAS